MPRTYFALAAVALAVSLLGLVVWLLAGTSTISAAEAARSEFDRRLLSLAGPGARNCGTAHGGGPSEGIRCAEIALKQGSGFRLVQEFVGIDSGFVVGIARTTSGETTELSYSWFASGEDASPLVRARRCSTLSVVLTPVRELKCHGAGPAAPSPN